MAKFDLLAIVGQTASGKTSLALDIAQVIPSEIIAADSRTVYKDLDIGTAKPSLQDRQAVRHHLLDIVGPNQKFSVADFQKLALRAIQDIHQRQSLPILVGGSGLYVDSILRNYIFPSQNKANIKLRHSLEAMTVEQLQVRIRDLGLMMPDNPLNKRYLIRTLERSDSPAPITQWRKKTLVVGLHLEKQHLRHRISQRLEMMLNQGLIDEISQVLQQYTYGCEALKGNVYVSFQPYLQGDISLQEAKADFIRRDLALAKKQITWFKRNPHIEWFNDVKQAKAFILKAII